MKYSLNLDYSIDKLKLSNTIISKLNDLKIITVEDLWKCSRIFLKNNGLTDLEIHEIQIQLQLRSIDFSKKVYKI